METGSDTLEMPAGVSAAPVETADDASFGGMQDRMGGDDVNAWLSPSEGAMVDGDTGEVLINPKTGEPFQTQEEYDAHLKGDQPEKKTEEKPAPNAQQKTTAKPETKPDPMSQGFDALILGGKPVTPEALVKIAGGVKTVDYNNELMAAVDPTLAKTQAGEQSPDPIEALKQQRTQIESRTIAPLEKAFAALVAAGVDRNTALEVMNPIYEEQRQAVESHFSEQMTKATEEAITSKLDKKYGGAISKAEQEQQELGAKQNIEKAARAFYPEHGPDAFFKLVAGSTDEKGQFQRGPSAIVVDALVRAMSLDKAHASPEDRQADYKASFGKLASNPAMANAMADIAHYYWLGKQVRAASKMSYDKGKAAATATAATRGKTVQTKPAAYNAEDDADTPALFRANLQRSGGR